MIVIQIGGLQHAVLSDRATPRGRVPSQRV